MRWAGMRWAGMPRARAALHRYVTPVEHIGEDVGDVLERLRWSVSGYRDDVLGAGERHPERSEAVRFHFVSSGELHVSGGAAEPVVLGAGDFLLLPRGGARVLATSGAAVVHTGELDVGSADTAHLIAAMPDTVVACCLLAKEPVVAGLLAGLTDELSRRRSGSRVVVAQLAAVVVVTAIRAWAESGCGSAHLQSLSLRSVSPQSVSLRDSDLGRALTAIHDDPGSDWTVDRLARVALSSRSAFAKRFRAALGESPARYLARVRMEQAKRLLTERATVAEVAVRLGYGSEAAFSRAFRRHAGMPPAHWRRSADDRAGAGVAVAQTRRAE